MNNAVKNILITGAGSGIGKGLARALAIEGHHVIATDLNLESTQLLAEELSELGYAAESATLNVCSDDSVNALQKQLDKNVDVLINCAGTQHVAPIEKFPQDKWNMLTDIMLNGPCRLVKAFLPNMRAQNFGRIINIGSIHSLIASPYKSAYVAAKHGLLGFSKTIALETANHNITINTICPSYVLTPLVEKQIAAQAKTHHISEDDVITDIMLKPMPKKSFISIDEISATAQFLMQNTARNITGQDIAIDGGWCIQ